jgi:hypothetical protein
MGKLLFVSTNRTNGIVGLLACAAAVLVGAWAALSGAYAGILFVLLGLLGSKFCLKIATQRAELYELGFVSRNIFGGVSARFADLKSIARGAVSRNGVVQSNIYFRTKSGETVTITREVFLKGDDKMQVLLDHACSALAQAWAKTLERQTEVVWLMKGSSPLLKIRKEGVLVEGKSGSDALIPLNQFRVQPLFGLEVQILNGDEKVLKANSGDSNYFVGQALIAMLQPKQQQSMAATTRG